MVASHEQSRRHIKTKAGAVLRLPERGLFPERAHVFEQDDIDAVDAALAAHRPLLLRGEPGTGKSQLAEAAAADLGWPIAMRVVDGRTESRDLHYEIDFVLRLAEAQLAGSVPGTERKQLKQDLDLHRFTRPGPLWRAFAWEEAADLGLAERVETPRGWKAGQGCVVLIDEIDKAEPDVPNGLLEALGHGRFRGPRGEEVVASGEPPLIVITSNDERELPDAFLRRCFVHWLALPEVRDDFVERLLKRGRAHFRVSSPHVGDGLMERVAETLFEERMGYAQGEARPGLAEYLDVLRVLAAGTGGEKEQLARFERVRRFSFGKFRTGPLAGAGSGATGPLV